MPGTHASTFETVFVCTGNRFRSPLAAALYRRATEGLPVTAASFGTLEIGPRPPLPEALILGAELGVDLAAHRSRAVAQVDLTHADLVVGFERTHLVTAGAAANAARDRTFTLPELVGLLEAGDPPGVADPVERARTQVSLAAARRPSTPDAIGHPELEDPLGLPGDRQRQVAGTIDDLIRGLAFALFGDRRR